MKLFSLPDGLVDRKDRAQWLTCPFDLAFSTVTIAPPIVTDIVEFTFTTGDRVEFSFTQPDRVEFSFTQGDRVNFVL